MEPGDCPSLATPGCCWDAHPPEFTKLCLSLLTLKELLLAELVCSKWHEVGQELEATPKFAKERHWSVWSEFIREDSYTGTETIPC